MELARKDTVSWHGLSTLPLNSCVIKKKQGKKPKPQQAPLFIASPMLNEVPKTRELYRQDSWAWQTRAYGLYPVCCWHCTQPTAIAYDCKRSVSDSGHLLSRTARLWYSEWRKPTVALTLGTQMPFVSSRRFDFVCLVSSSPFCLAVWKAPSPPDVVRWGWNFVFNFK